MPNQTSSTKRSILLGATAFLGVLGAMATGCGDDKGTDIAIPAEAGKAGQNAGGSANHAGSSNGAGTTGVEGGAPNDGGAAGADSTSGSGGRAGSSSGGKGGAAGNAGSAGTTGSGGNAGTAGSGGLAGHGGSAGSAGSGGSAGTAGTTGNGGMAGNGGTAGSAGTAGRGGSAGTSGSGGTANLGCGDGKVAGTEECDNGADDGKWQGDRLCSDDCQTVATQECVDCEQAGDCFASSDNCMGPSGAPFSLANVSICYDVFQCFQDSKCMDGAGSLGKCYCGSLSTAACGSAPYDLSQQGAPNGPCAEIMQLGMPGVTSNSTVLGGLTNKSRPAGEAGQRMNCQKNDMACSALCGITLPL